MSKVFYDKVSQLCSDHGVSISKGMEALGMTKGAATRWIDGGNPTRGTMQKIAKHFGVPIEYLEDDNTELWPGRAIVWHPKHITPAPEDWNFYEKTCYYAKSLGIVITTMTDDMEISKAEIEGWKNSAFPPSEKRIRDTAKYLGLVVDIIYKSDLAAAIARGESAAAADKEVGFAANTDAQDARRQRESDLLRIFRCMSTEGQTELLHHAYALMPNAIAENRGANEYPHGRADVGSILITEPKRAIEGTIRFNRLMCTELKNRFLPYYYAEDVILGAHGLDTSVISLLRKGMLRWEELTGKYGKEFRAIVDKLKIPAEELEICASLKGPYIEAVAVDGNGEIIDYEETKNDRPLGAIAPPYAELEKQDISQKSA